MSRSIKLVSRSVFLVACVLTVISVFRTLPESKRSLTPLLQFSYQSQFLESRKIIEGSNSKGLEGELVGEEEEEEEEWDLEQENVPDLPLILGTSFGPMQYNASCAKFPNLYTVQFSNIHWQVQETMFETYFLYAAYLDVRGMKNASDLKRSKVTVRILGMSNNFTSVSSNHMLKVCQFWFEGKSKPKFGIIMNIKILWHEIWGLKGHYFPFLITCQFPKYLKEVPVSVSLVERKCDDATNNLNILHRDQLEKVGHIPKKNFGVCVKALDFPDDYMASRPVEWVETIRSLGADKIFFYEFYVDSAIKKILDHYESTGIIDVMQTTLPGELPNQPQLRHLYIRGKKLDKRLTELIPYNDCLLRHMYDFKYVVVIDTDELIMPKTAENWAKLLEDVISQDLDPTMHFAKVPLTTFCFHNVYFVDNMMIDNLAEISDIPHEFHMLQHIYRARHYTANKHMKCFHSTSETLAVHNHFPFHCLNGRCNRHYVDFNRAQLNHYRSTCVADIKNCSAYLNDKERDTGIWRYKDEIMERASEVMKIAM